MFIEQGVKKENPFWKYIVGSILIILASTIGQIPFGIAVLMKTMKSGTMPTDSAGMLRVLESNLSLFLMMLSFVFALLGVFIVIKYFHKQTILEVTTSRSKIDWSRVFFSFGLWAVFTISSVLLTYYLSPEEMIWNFKPIPFAILVLIGVILIPIQTSTEEYVFRGYLMQGFANLSKNKWFPLLMTSVIFGTMHIFNPEIDKMGNIVLVYYIGTGLFLGIITLMDEGMELALGFHAANNLVTALLVTSDWSALQTNSIFKDISDPSAGLEIIIPVFVIFPLLLLLFSKKYKWSDWKEKLTGDIKYKTTINELNND
ncbi:lysostaphin resistance A-like protein [Flavobacterium sp.]|jgi:membrane protease YdiL (CAAX protease family)|uniref:lysostaphin resistance A-like protein n=1 Tax=Flavobacterium sp. TaxID=239 RepID=UPI0037BE9CE4